MHPLTTWLALAGSIWALFALAEDRLSPPQRQQVTHWLRGQTPHWPDTFLAVYDSVFGQPGFSGARFLRACIASQITAFLALCLSGVYYPGTAGLMLLVLGLYAPALCGGLALMSLLPGYVSLVLHRALLERLSHSHAPQYQGSWTLLASLATGLCALLACYLSFLVVVLCSQADLLRRPVAWIVGYVEFSLKTPGGSLSALYEALFLQPIIVPGVAFPSFGIWLYAPCFPFVWALLYRLAGRLIRSASARGYWQTTAPPLGLLDIDTRPLHTLGAVAVGGVSLLYWGTLAWYSW
ncbi:MAG: hypothetical protein FJZ47_25280 [Candidatus Tectomicrobia bacterium]|uniref:Uncharacterized protein n=1 Tax=Tectimicrobiota bacterium TaxID=2528274 RepID=A0A937W7X3_UNCTE|nr:hypothetical protein [Candidatus Tectomicrobia bacterium]